jgi:hypothetical protein
VRTARLPRLVLLDARRRGLDPAGLRYWARQTGDGDAGFVSRSYCYPFALVGWHEQPLGVDIERIEPCDDAFAELICTPEEWATLAEATDRDRLLTSLWSSKEALAKLLGNPLHYRPRDLTSPGGWSEDPVGPLRASPIVLPDGYVGWVCWRASGNEAPGPRPPVRPQVARPGSGPQQGVVVESTHRWPSQRTVTVQREPSQ